MRLISCHIENFGKLSDKTVSFAEPSGINVLCEKNGWGKSTLAAFIKVMFFGFDNEGRRNSVENERQRFKPWQGGVYGGQLTFEADGKTYIISRTFGAREKDDEFVLQDEDTKLELTNYSKNIGEELFQIDKASFARSIYISQNDCVTATTDSINAKLGKLTDNTDDLNNYETVVGKMTDMLNALSKTRKTGELYKQKEEIARLRQEIKMGETLDVSMEEILKHKNELQGSYETLKEEQKQLQDRQKSISEYKDVLVKKKDYDLLCETEAKTQKLYEEKKTLFPSRIPDGEEIDKYIELEYRTSVLKKNMDSNRPGDEEGSEFALLEEKFHAGMPTKEEIEEVKGKVNDMQTLRWSIEKSMLSKDEKDDLERLEEMFSGKVPPMEEIDALSNAWSLRSEKKNTLSSKQATVEMLKLTALVNEDGTSNDWGKIRSQSMTDDYEKKSEKSNKKSSYKVAATALLIVMALIGMLLCLVVPLVGIVVLAADIIAAIFCCVAAVTSAASAKKGERSDKKAEANDKAESFSHSYMKLEKEIADDEALIYKTETDMKQFLAKYDLPYEENSVMSDLYRLKEDIKLYGNLLGKAQNSEADRLKERYDRLHNEVEGFLQKYGFGLDRIDEDSADIVTYYVNLIYKLEVSAGKYISLKNNKENLDKSYEEYKKNIETLNAFINEINILTDVVETPNLNFLLRLIKDTRDAYLHAKSEYEEAVRAKNQYETQNQKVLDVIKNAEMLEEDTSLAGIEERLSEISTELEKYHTSMAAYNRQLDELQEKRDEITESENRLEELQELYELNEKRLITLQKTQKYLEQAKISLTAKYTKPIKDAFDKYFGILCDIESENYQLDANFNLSVIERGLPRDTAFLSAGYQDMIGICMRMALIDAMYEEEKPFVLFDDPFVNLDAEKTQGALKLLDVIAKEYQVVYFTCNANRR